MSRLYVDKVQANTTDGDVTLETNLIVSGNLNVTGIFDAHVSDFKVSANQTILGDASSDTITFNAATASIPNGLSFLTGSVAVGTTTLSAPSGVAKYVLVSDASSAGISLNDTGGTQWDIYSADSKLHFFASTQGSGIEHRMVMQENGQIGIGTNNPSAPSGMARYLTIEDSSSAGISVSDTGGTQWDIYSADSRLHFFAGSQGVGIAHRMVIQENGNVGIGTINPSTLLEVAGDITVSGAATFAGAATFNGGLSAGDANITNVGDIALDSISSDAGTTINVTLGTDAGDDFIVATDALVVEGDNKNIGVGTTTPTSNAGVSKFIEISDATSAGVVLHDTGGREWTIYNGDGKLYHHSDSSGQVLTLWGSDVGINTATPGKTLDVNGDARIGDDLLLQSDAAVLSFGADDDVSLTHVADTGLLLNGTMKIQFNDASQFIHGSDANTLALGATAEIDLTATSIDINGEVDMSAGLTVASDLTVDTSTLKVDSSNNRVGVGTTSPETALHIQDGSAGTIATTSGALLTLESNEKPKIHFQSPGGYGGSIIFGSPTDNDEGQIDYDHGSDRFLFKTGGNTKMAILGDNVGIGTASPSSLLHVDGDALIGDDLSLKSDSAVLNFGADDDVSLTHVADTGLLLNSDMKIQFNDASQFIHGSSATVLSIGATDEIDLTATSIDINGAADISGNLVVGGNLTVSGTTTTVNTANITVEDPLLLLASGQSGTPSVDAGLIIERGTSTNVTMIWDESEDEFAFATTTSAADTAGNVSIAAYASLQVNALTAGSLDISGDADIDGTLEADAITVNGTTLAEVISDTAGAMFSSNTETGITATYQDADNTIDLEIAAAQTSITSLLATDIKIGEDDETKIDFETANEIHFYANNVEQVYLADNIFGPQSDSDVDLGSTTVRWKDAYVDTVTTTGAVNAGGNLATLGTLTVASTTLLSDNVKIIDDKTLTFGTNDDWTIEYDENGDDDLVMTGTTLSVVTDTATFTSANSADPVVVIKNTTNDTTGPRLQLVKDKGAAGAADDVNGLIQFVGDDANQDQVTFSQIMSQVKVATNGQEGGKLTVSVAENDGALTAGLVIEDGDADGELDATIGAGTSSVVTTAGNLKVTGNIIQNSEGTTTITMDTSENITVAGGIVATAASTFNADVSLGENNITNVGDINCDSISVDGAATGLNLDFSGANTGTGKITLADNLASAVVVTESSNAYVTFVTSDGAEKVQFSQDILVDKTTGTTDAGTSGVGATQAAVTMNGTRRGTITVTTDQAIANSGTNAFLGIQVTADHVLETDSISVSTGMMRNSSGTNLATSATKAYAINQVDGAFVILIDGLGNSGSVGDANSTIKVNWVAL